MNRRSAWVYAWLAVAGVLSAAEPSPVITIAADRPGAVYACGEEARLAISVKDGRGGLLTTGQVVVTLDNFGTNRIFAATVDLAKPQPFLWSGTLREPGFLRCGASLRSGGAKPAVYGIGFSPSEIRLGSGGPPADFDAYWRGEIERLDREVPLDPRMERLDVSGPSGAEAFRVSFATFNGKRVYGFLTLPKDTKKGPFSVRITVPWAGPGAYAPELKAEDANVITLTLNVHDYEPGPDAAANRKKYDAQSRRYAEEVKGIRLKSSYENHRYAGYTDRSEYFYHDALLGMRRGILWLLRRPEADQRRVGCCGRSQGGGIGLMLAALTPGVTRALLCQPALVDLHAYKQGRRAGWPCLIERARPADRARVEKTAAYYDAGHFASRLTTCEVRVIIGFADDTCPPPCVYAAYNAVQAPKSIIHDVGVPHSDPPSFQQNQAWVLEAPVPVQETQKKAFK